MKCGMTSVSNIFKKCNYFCTSLLRYPFLTLKSRVIVLSRIISRYPSLKLYHYAISHVCIAVLRTPLTILL